MAKAKNLLLVIPKLLKLQDLLRAQNNDYMYNVWYRSELIRQIQIDIDKHQVYYTSMKSSRKGLTGDDLKFWNKIYADLTENKA